jgi:hypothetical protein
MNKPLRQRKCLTTKASIGVHLAAAGLLRTKFDFDPQPFQDLNDGTASFRKKRIVVTRDK